LIGVPVYLVWKQQGSAIRAQLSED
jgi:hypothetical protein